VRQRPPQIVDATVAHSRRVAASGITVRSDELRVDEVRTIDGIDCTTAARMAYDLGRRLPLETAVIRIGALLNATAATLRSVEDYARCHSGARGLRRFRTALDLADAGAESPQETRLRVRLALRRSGFPD
jgi:hypothetical protein